MVSLKVLKQTKHHVTVNKKAHVYLILSCLALT